MLCLCSCGVGALAHAQQRQETQQPQGAQQTAADQGSADISPSDRVTSGVTAVDDSQTTESNQEERLAPIIPAPAINPIPQTTQPQISPAPATRQPATTGSQDVAPQVQQDVSRNLNRLRRTPAFASNLFSRGAGRINMISDFFGVGQNQLTVALPFSFPGVPSTILGPTALGFDISNDAVLDLFTVGPPTPDLVYNLLEPTPPTAAPIPNASGFQYAGGTATPNPPISAPQQDAPYDLIYAYSNTLLVPGGGNLLLGRQKIAANVSPVPRTRIFADYSYFNNTILLSGADVHRWTPGFEYAFDDDTSSVELRVPMGITINSEIFSEQLDDAQYEVGNLFLAWKSVLLERRNWLVSGGVSVTVPTGDDINVYMGASGAGRRQLLEIRNRSVHVQPFVGWATRHGRLFSQGFVQADLDVNGSPVAANLNLNQSALSPLGVVQNTNLIFFDAQFGYWLRRINRPCRHSPCITGLAPLWEIHVNRSLQATDVVGSATDFVGSGGFQVGAPLQDLQLINTVVGVMVEHNFHSQWNLGFAMPLGNGVDAAFDGELRVAFNRYF